MSKKNAVIKGTAILTVANLLSRIIGAIFKIPLANLIGQYGMGLFALSYTFYSFTLEISTTGFPIAVSKMVAESVARNDYPRTKIILRNSLLLLGTIGIAGSFLLWFYSRELAVHLGNIYSSLGIKCAAPAIFFVSIVSVFRGYFQGFQNMYPTAISEVIEALFKLLIGYLLASIFFVRGIEYSSAGAVLGVTIGTVFSFIVMIFIYILSIKRDRARIITTRKMYSSKSIFKELICIALPITLGAVLSNITNLVDLVTITRGLQKISGIDSIQASSLYGSYTGYAVPIFSFPLIIVYAIRMTMVPAIAGALAQDDSDRARKIIAKAHKLLIIFSVSCSAGLIVLADSILNLFFVSNNSTMLLQILSIAILPNAMIYLTSSALQAYGKVNIPVINMLVGGIIKVTINYFMIPRLGIVSAPISTTICFVVISVLNFIHLIKITSFKICLSEYLKPTISALLMSIATIISYRYSLTLFHSLGMKISSLISLIISAGISIIVYFILLLMTKSISAEDIAALPYGNTILTVLHKII